VEVVKYGGSGRRYGLCSYDKQERDVQMESEKLVLKWNEE
jgi:hypothetical protein